MIKFFRKIRQRLLSENKFSKYLLYAIGEIVLVVIGILIALEINNWNESRKLESKKQELIINLINDFEGNIELLQPAIKQSDTLSFKMDAFLTNAYLSNLAISVDSLKVLADGFFRPVYFYPSIVSYDEAKANGNLTLLKNKELFKDFNAFHEELSNFQNLQNDSRESYFNGPMWELKKVAGSGGVFIGSKKSYIKNSDDKSYMKLVHLPLATAVFENEFTLNYNVNFHLKNMKYFSDKIVKTLTEMKK
ncbi:hypothetical protein FDT66_10600 [Polaribacter aestuariivivens]|uniref:Uncharacterized protein n=1 Tax=Polaribacter aestuariivivens TaxID=2304626 RepID=A0A5S3N858_9FLAO|nr:DUF6090 family protein [Polaribacter aestuariivivens]TMM29559.1 hypothetical protein FDT66_10600 [Polaribacter aestuariivivens]